VISKILNASEASDRRSWLADRSSQSASLFNCFWHGSEFSPLELCCLKSFLNFGHGVRLFTYDEVHVPDGIIQEDARKILPLESVFRFQNSLAAFTDIFRYKLLYEQGGWWIDTDVVCLTENIPPCAYFWAEEEPGRINGAILRFPAQDPLCHRLLNLSVERNAALSRWGEIGPDLLTEVLGHLRLQGHAGSTKDAYPIHWLETHFLWLPEYADAVRERCTDSLFLHLWQSCFSRIGMDRTSYPPVGSILQELYVREGVSSQTASPQCIKGRVRDFLQEQWVLEWWEKRLNKKIEDLMPVDIE